MQRKRNRIKTQPTKDESIDVGSKDLLLSNPRKTVYSSSKIFVKKNITNRYKGTGTSGQYNQSKSFKPSKMHGNSHQGASKSNILDRLKKVTSQAGGGNTKPIQNQKQSETINTSAVKKIYLPSIVSSIMTNASMIVASKPRISQSTLSQLNLSSTSWYLFDTATNFSTGFREHYRRQIASLTKMMTAVIVAQWMASSQINKNCLLRVSKTAAQAGGTTAGLKEGWWVSIEDLLYGMMLPSGNDAAYTLAEYFGYFFINPCYFPSNQEQCKYIAYKDLNQVDLTSQSQSTISYIHSFLRRMNHRAIELNMISTRYSNPHGLQNAMNISSAKDVALLGKHASQLHIVKECVMKEYWKYQIVVDKESRKKIKGRWWNTNKLLGKGWQGMKTGQTPTAGACLCSLKAKVFIVVLKSNDSQSRFTQTEKIYEWYTSVINGKSLGSLSEEDITINNQEPNELLAKDDEMQTMDLCSERKFLLKKQ